MGRRKLTEAEKYQKKLERLINNPPDGLRVCYDYMSTSLYVVYENAEFFDNESRNMSAIIGSTTPQNAMGYGQNTGNDRDMIVGDSIYVELEAMQQ